MKKMERRKYFYKREKQAIFLRLDATLVFLVWYIVFYNTICNTSSILNRIRFLGDKLSERRAEQKNVAKLESEFLSPECFWYFWQQKYNQNNIS